MTGVIILLAIALLAGVLAAVVLLQPPVAPEPPGPKPAPVEDADLADRRRAAEQIGTQLLERRVELDGRRGPLQGHDELDLQFTRLEEQLRSGSISDEEFEAEKIRLLGG